jgi:hypothetical protein
MADPAKVKVGDVLYDTRRVATRIRGMSEMGSWEVYILELPTPSWEVYILELPTPEHPYTWKVGWNLPSQVKHYGVAQIRKLRLKPYEPRTPKGT